MTVEHGVTGGGNILNIYLVIINRIVLKFKMITTTKTNYVNQQCFTMIFSSPLLATQVPAIILCNLIKRCSLFSPVWAVPLHHSPRPAHLQSSLMFPDGMFDTKTL